MPSAAWYNAFMVISPLRRVFAPCPFPPAPGGAPSARAARNLLAAAGLLALGALALGGCDSGSDPAPTTPAAPAPAPAPAPEPEPTPCAEACPTDGGMLDFGFFYDFAPMSYSADRTPGSEGFNTHMGYEADLVSALEAMDGAELSFSRRAIDSWPGIWLRPATDGFDIVGGGITILDSRTRDDSGEVVVWFTSGHVAFRQSLLVRSADAARLASYDDLTSDVRVAVLAGTTGEGRLLQLSGLADSNGVLVAGARITTPEGELVTDGTDAYVIRSSGTTPNLAGRQHLTPPSEDMPQVVFFNTTEAEMLASVLAGTTDALARGEIGNQDAVAESAGALTVSALDSKTEYGGFSLKVEDQDLLTCVDDKINYLTDNRRIGYGEWRANPMVFTERAEAWVCGGS